MPWLIYVANVILGIGAAVIWTAQVIFDHDGDLMIILVIIVLVNSHLDGPGNL